ncbi:SRPBCC family protein [Olleya sp. YS]|uniref:SRPBCC family protein n=1 Tax=Olleya sp. YS TaxID=3028318 RepID=UPI0024345E78|nr:SRPBCC family protein [Olleya sp. YS]WGD34086.1 SRPBCC family protein [Olleya sp. YS]
MKYTVQVTINKSLHECFKLLDDHENMKHWQEGLVSYEHISGDPGTVNAKMKLNYNFGNRKMTLVETITFKEKNKAYHFNFDTKGMHNIQQNFFEAIDDNTTQWTSINEFAPTNFTMRMMALLMPKAFKKQSKKYLTDFKNFAENGTSLAK